MKAIVTLAATAVLAFGFAGSASAGAFTFSPIKTNFTASGTGTVSKDGVNVPCSVSLQGRVNAMGHATIRSAAFSGSTACNLVTASGLPWTVTSPTATRAIIQNLTLTATGLGTCGPSKLRIAVSNTGAWTFNNATLAGGCVVSGSLTTKPAITIVP